MNTNPNVQCHSCKEWTTPGEFCTYCGANLANTKKGGRKFLKWTGIGCGGLFGLFVLLVILAVIFGEDVGSEESVGQETALGNTSPSTVTPVETLAPTNTLLPTFEPTFAPAPTPTNTPLPTPTPLLTLAITQLKQEYDANKIAADQVYEGKFIRVTGGQIYNISRDIIGTPYLSLKADNSFDFWGLKCVVREEEELTKFVNGQHVTVQGVNDGMSLGIVVFNPCTVESAPSPVSPVDAIKLEPLTIKNIGISVGERNNTWWRIAFKFDVTNSTDSAHTFDARIQWVDAEGFELDQSTERGLTVPPSSTQTYTGSDLVDASIASRVNRVQITIQR